MKLHVVPARAGVQWVKLGIKTFFRQPLALSGLFLMFLAVMSILSIVPMIGNALALILLPGATLGLMVATEEAANGKFPMPAVLLTAFKNSPKERQSMLILGGVYAACFLLVLAITALADGGQFARLYLMGGTISEEMLQDDRFELAALIAAGLYLPLSMLFWHAPALVHWHGVSPAKSLFFSIVACLRNFWAFNLFGVLWLATFIVIGMLVAAVIALLGNPQWVAATLFPTAIWMASMFFTSIFFTFKDSFESPTGATP
jgi:hypothetical protein